MTSEQISKSPKATGSKEQTNKRAKSPVDRLLSRRCMIRFCKQNTKPSRMSKEFYTAVRKSMLQYIEDIVKKTCDNATNDKKFSCLPRHCVLTDVHAHGDSVSPTIADEATTDTSSNS